MAKFKLKSNKNVIIRIIEIMITIMIIEGKLLDWFLKDVTANLTNWSSRVAKISKLYFKVPSCFIILNYLPFVLSFCAKNIIFKFYPYLAILFWVQN